ncbi:MAG: DNA translocase FtsK [Bacteroidetes bacterium]|nr:DNA translocase FtsK [Bacteroidota bacterium]
MAKSKFTSGSDTEEEIPWATEQKPLAKKILGRKTQLIVGTGLLLGTFYLILACVSFLFSGEHDLHLILGGDASTRIADAPQYENWMGKMGAWAAYILMFKGFGVGAFFISYILMMLGSQLVVQATPTPFFKSFRWMTYGMLFIPLILGFLFHHREDDPFPHIVLDINDRFIGAYGLWITQWCTFTLGNIGTGVVLAGIAITSFLLHFGSWVDQAIQRIREKREMDHAARIQAEIEKAEEMAAQEEVLATAMETPEAIAAPMIPIQEEVTTITNTFIQPEPTDEELLSQIEVLDPIESEESEESEIEQKSEPLEEIELSPLVAVSPNGMDLSSLENDLGMEVQGPAEDDILSSEEVDERLADFGDYDPKLDLSRYEAPSIELLKNHTTGGIKITKEELEANKNKIIETLNHYKIEIEKIKATIGPTVTLYEINPAPGVRISKIKNLEDDIALSLAALGIRIIAPIPGKGTIGIEVPNSQPEVVSMRSLIASEKFQNAEMELPVVLGKTISNEIFCVDLAKMPHLLMAGSTGQGKSVGLNAILVSLLYKKHPSQIKFVLVDPKKVELTLFNKIERHFLAKLPDSDDPIITDTSKVVRTLNSLCIEMDQRYDLLKTAGCRNIKEYNERFIKRRLNPENGHRYLPYIVLVVDEFADLIMTAGREVEMPIARLAQLARAIGIHLIIATQRPSVNIITGTIKANFPARIAFRVTSKIDSRTILDAGGADQLIGRGDLLYSTGNDLIRVQCGFVDTPEVEEITEFIGNQQGYTNAFLLPEVPDEAGSSELSNLADGDRDELFNDAARIVVQTQQGSASMLQRKLKLGFNRAGRIVDQLEAAGIIGPFEGSKARKVLFQDEASLEQFLKNDL